MAVIRKAATKSLLKNIATHVSIDNNDGVQGPITGTNQRNRAIKGTTDDTNITIFQPLCNGT